MPRLSDYFSGVMIKRLSTVETDRGRSNQHEFNGTVEMREHLGRERQELPARFIRLGVDEDHQMVLDDIVTWYDARESHPTRSEHRLYFRDNEVMDKATAGDVLIIGLQQDRSVVMLVVSSASPELNDVLWLFGAREQQLQGRLNIDPNAVEQQSLALFSLIAEQAGLDIEPEPRDDWLDLLLERFGERFPGTRELSELALTTLASEVSAIDDPDGTLLALMDREEVLFRQLERHIVSQHLAAHARNWSADVDAFISFSLSVQNRRKSRAGHALENQLEWILRTNEIRFERGSVTEGRSKPDFLFPGSAFYRDASCPSEYLTMLGVKTTCKDRWRQVLNEASRIPRKHLLTLQPAISEHQTEEMRAADLSLVIPVGLHTSYSDEQQHSLLSVKEFMNLVAERERWLM